MSNTGRRSLLVLVLLTLMMLFWWQLLPDADERAVVAEPEPEAGWFVDHVIDGDTIIVVRGGVEETVRLIGIDTPEREECGYEDARQFMVDIVLDQEVALVAGATTDRDSYGRLLRYVEYGGLDVGLGQIAEGYAVARYDSRTNQPHPREDVYREADAGTAGICE
ncbi:MAG: hypothetical protein CVT64_02555 [Actinobacteria bacterium HGW-Actinobacteria-4]|nr:MAG: hypothetical protein CVT64_02555 [Actinobacteria bacterium HGW-Actinobacteria-4]